MESLLDKKYRYDSLCAWDFGDWNTPKNKYGFVRIKNPDYEPYGDERKYIVRKPTPQERREIVINTIIECNGRTFKIPALAKGLGVSDRTIQKILRELEKEELIEIIPTHTKKGAQKGNAYRYVGSPCVKYGLGLTLQMLHNAKQNVGFRNWSWKEFVFPHDKIWYDDNYIICKAKFEQRVARRKYLEQNNLPLVVSEDTKYLVLRYSYWEGTYSKLYDGTIFSHDTSLKLSIFPLDRTETVTLYKHSFTVDFGGTKDNPQITISDVKTQETLGIFTWFDENIIEIDNDINGKLNEQYFILGDFTTK